MSKLAHSNEETMELIEFKAHIRDDNDDAIWSWIQSLKKENSKLREVLQFYADEGNWIRDVEEAAGAPVYVPNTAIAEFDHGQRALDALNERNN